MRRVDVASGQRLLRRGVHLLRAEVVGQAPRGVEVRVHDRRDADAWEGAEGVGMDPRNVAGANQRNATHAVQPPAMNNVWAHST